MVIAGVTHAISAMAIESSVCPFRLVEQPVCRPQKRHMPGGAEDLVEIHAPAIQSLFYLFRNRIDGQCTVTVGDACERVAVVHPEREGGMVLPVVRDIPLPFRHGNCPECVACKRQPETLAATQDGLLCRSVRRHPFSSGKYGAGSLHRTVSQNPFLLPGHQNRRAG